MDEERVMEHYFGSTPKVKILEMLFIGRAFDYSISDMAERSGTSRTAIYALLEEMLKEKIIIETRKLGRMRLFKINQENLSVQTMIVFFDNLLKVNSDKEIKRQMLKVKVKN